MNDPVVDALLPPAILALLTLVLLILARRRAALLTLGALVLLSVEAVPHWLFVPLLPAPRQRAGPPPGAIVVFAGASPEILDPANAVPGLETLQRLRTAAALSRQVGLPILVSGARASVGPISVASEMAQSLESDFLVHPAWIETSSTNLWQSAEATAAMLRGSGVTEIYLVAQPWEVRLSASVFRSAGLGVRTAPVPHDGLRPLGLSAFVAITPAWLDSTVAIRQWIGLACQATPSCVAWMRRPTPGPN